MRNKKSKPTKESTPASRKKEDKGRPPAVAVQRRVASPDEAAAIDQALDRLLTELIRQARAPAPGRKKPL